MQFLPILSCGKGISEVDTDYRGDFDFCYSGPICLPNQKDSHSLECNYYMSPSTLYPLTLKVDTEDNIPGVQNMRLSSEIEENAVGMRVLAEHGLQLHSKC